MKAFADFTEIDRSEMIRELGHFLSRLNLGVQLRPIYSGTDLKAVRVIVDNKKAAYVEVGMRSRFNIVKDIVNSL